MALAHQKRMRTHSLRPGTRRCRYSYNLGDAWIAVSCDYLQPGRIACIHYLLSFATKCSNVTGFPVW